MKFIGKDRSLGYRYGFTYELYINKNKINCINSHNLVNNGYCIYESVEAFLKNWE